eukprot:1048743-Prymnesium_polylepis.2
MQRRKRAAPRRAEGRAAMPYGGVPRGLRGLRPGGGACREAGSQQSRARRLLCSNWRRASQSGAGATVSCSEDEQDQERAVCALGDWDADAADIRVRIQDSRERCVFSTAPWPISGVCCAAVFWAYAVRS